MLERYSFKKSAYVIVECTSKVTRHELSVILGSKRLKDKIYDVDYVIYHNTAKLNEDQVNSIPRVESKKKSIA